jgi:hypothetical protein
VLRYELPVDQVRVGRSVDATFRLGPDGWQLARVDGDQRDLWEHEPVEVASAGQSLVVASSRLASRLPSLAKEVEAAREQVAGFWSAQWPATVVVVVPSEARSMGSLIGGGELSQLPAVTSWNPGRGGPVVRVVLNPEAFLGLPSIAQRIVLRHEITHVAQNALQARNVPTWLSEGVAEYIGYRGTGIPDSIVGAGAFDLVRSNGVPEALPGEDDFAFNLTAGQRTLAYERAWAACRMIADVYGESRIIRFYRAASAGSGSSEARVDRAARKVLGVSGAQFVRQWQSWLTGHA